MINKKLNSFDNVTEWINLLIQERISEKINVSLNYKNKTWLVSYKNHNQFIEMKFFEKLYITGYQEDLPCGFFCLENKVFENLHETLPAPGFNSKSTKSIFTENSLCKINYDIFGFSFWMLNRLEELYIPNNFLDKHGRFNFKYSHAYKYDYLSRPLVDEWIQFLRLLLKSVYPKIKLKKSKFRILPTHDIDNPRKFSMISKLRVLKNKIKFFLESPNEIFNLSNKQKSIDPYDSFDWILDISDKYNLKNEFYFMTAQTNWRYDTGYKITNSTLLTLLKKINDRGHLIGLHPSYDSDSIKANIFDQANSLNKIFKIIGVKQNKIGSRMHYLKFSNPKTSYELINAGFNYDSSLGYANFPGFRCGTCKEYNLFDPIKNQILDLRERPLILMESSVLLNKKIGDNVKIYYDKYIKNLKEKCSEVEGEFLFLWHNCKLETKANKELYELLLQPLNN